MRNGSLPSESPHPIARHGVLPTPHPARQLLAALGILLVVVLVSGVGIGVFAVWDTARAVSDHAVDIGEDGQPLPPSLGEIEGGVNLLMVGTDACEGQDPSLSRACSAGTTSGERNDVTMLVHISDEPRRVTVVSFPRDMVVPIPACPRPEGGEFSAMSAQKLNASYTYGGLACTVRTIQELTGEQIQFAAAIRWTGVINMSDAIGGVDVCVTGEINDKHTGLHLTPGTHTLQGVEALQFLRIRHGIADGSDLGRISNQQQFMSSLVRKLQSSSVLGDPSTLFSLATTAMSQVTQGQLTLSKSLTNPALMVQIAMALKDVDYSDIVFVQYPTRYVPRTSGEGSDVMPVRDAGEVLFTALRENKPLELTGKTSQAAGAPEVKGEASKPKPSASPSASPSPGETDASAPPADASGDPAPPADEVVKLPSSITGTTAAQVTCTKPQR